MYVVYCKFIINTCFLCPLNYLYKRVSRGCSFKYIAFINRGVLVLAIRMLFWGAKRPLFASNALYTPEDPCKYY